MKKWKKLSLFIGVPVLLVALTIPGTMWFTQDEETVSTSEMSIDRFETMIEERDALNKRIKFYMDCWDRRRKKYEAVLEDQPGVTTSVE